jgi:hypothetical protein
VPLRAASNAAPESLLSIRGSKIHEDCRRYRKDPPWTDVLPVRIKRFFSFLPAQLPPGVAGQFLSFVLLSHYVYLVAATQLVAGILLLINRYVVLALPLLAPVNCKHRDVPHHHATGDGAACRTRHDSLDFSVLAVPRAFFLPVGPEVRSGKAYR